jgi:hypothetical protein
MVIDSRAHAFDQGCFNLSNLGRIGFVPWLKQIAHLVLAILHRAIQTILKSPHFLKIYETTK